ncbi:MAG TPA: hypothetical protein VJA17_03875, partial [Candidatus Omnitrophota bacterium]|nr:hypothetical protein [Candidatus Omnitrophota bacterium]
RREEKSFTADQRKEPLKGSDQIAAILFLFKKLKDFRIFCNPNGGNLRMIFDHILIKISRIVSVFFSIPRTKNPYSLFSIDCFCNESCHPNSIKLDAEKSGATFQVFPYFVGNIHQ